MNEQEIETLQTINTLLKQYMKDVSQIKNTKLIWWGLCDAQMEIDKRLKEYVWDD